MRMKQKSCSLLRSAVLFTGHHHHPHHHHHLHGLRLETAAAGRSGVESLKNESFGRLTATTYSVAAVSKVETGFFPEWLISEEWRQQIGMSVLIWGMMLFIRGKARHMNEMTSSGRLISNGIYGISRNPTAFGVILAYSGVALLANNGLISCMVPVVYGIFRFHSIPAEEKELTKKFGIEYEQYCQSVNRFFTPTQIPTVIMQQRQIFMAKSKKKEKIENNDNDNDRRNDSIDKDGKFPENTQEK